MKNQGEEKKNTKAKQKRDTILKLEFLKLISYVADLTGLFLFSGVNNKRKSRDQW